MVLPPGHVLWMEFYQPKGKCSDGHEPLLSGFRFLCSEHLPGLHPGFCFKPCADPSILLELQWFISLALQETKPLDGGVKEMLRIFPQLSCCI